MSVCVAGANRQDARVHADPGAMSGRAVGSEVHPGCAGLPLPAHPHGATQALPVTKVLQGERTGDGEHSTALPLSN